jgi:hypothetical protein
MPYRSLIMFSELTYVTVKIHRSSARNASAGEMPGRAG